MKTPKEDIHSHMHLSLINVQDRKENPKPALKPLRILNLIHIKT